MATPPLSESVQSGHSSQDLQQEDSIKEMIEAIIARKLKEKESMSASTPQEVQEAQEEDEMMQLLSSDEEEEETVEVNEQIAEYIDKRLSEKIPYEKLKVKLKNAKRPRNIKFSRETKINRHIYNNISLVAKKRDTGLRRIQGMVAKGINQMAKVANLVLEKGKQQQSIRQWSDDDAHTLHKDVFDSLAIMCQVSREINVKRVGTTYWKISKPA